MVANRSEIAFSHTNLAICILATEHLWWLLMNASLLEAYRHCVCQYFICLHYDYSTAYQMLSLWSMQILYAKKTLL